MPETIEIDEETKRTLSLMSSKFNKKQKELGEKIKEVLAKQEKLIQIKYFEVEANKRLEHRKELAIKYHVEQNPKINMAYELAWEYGHANGFNEVENYFRDLVCLIIK